LNLAAWTNEPHEQKVARTCFRAQGTRANLLVAKAENQPVCVLEFVYEWLACGSVSVLQAKVKHLL